MNNKDSEIIKDIRFPLTFIVVMQHCMGSVYYDFEWTNLSGSDIYNIIKILLSGSFAAIAVPAFFLISGFLFFNKIEHFDLSVYKSKLSSRLRTLLVPYILWPVFVVPCAILIIIAQIHLGKLPSETIHNYLSSIDLNCFFWDHQRQYTEQVNLFNMHALKTKPFLGTFWFIRDLILMVLLSPLVYVFVKKVKGIGIALLTVLFLLRLWPEISLTLSAVYFFALGAFLSINGRHIYTSNKATRVFLYAISSVSLCAIVATSNISPFWSYQLEPLYTISGTLAFINITYYIKERRWKIPNHPILSDSSFFVYAFHHDIALPLGFFISKGIFMGCEEPFIKTIEYIITPCIIYGICIMAYMIMKRFMPKLLNVLTGSRAKKS